MILILATDFDNLANGVGQFTTAQSTKINEVKALSAQVNSQKVLIVGSGSTKVELASTVASILAECPVEAIICVGNTAALCNNVSMCTVAICEEAIQHDVNFCPLGCPAGVIPEVNRAVFCASDELVCLAKEAAREERIRCETGRCISGDQFVACTEEACSLRNKFNADFLDTESGTVGQLAYMNNIPFVSIKGVCNYADCNAVCDYRRCRQQANWKAMKVAMELICNMND